MLENVFRSLFFFFDTIIYQFISILYNFVTLLAKQQVIDSVEIEKFGKNIYALLAIFMLFRLAFVLLNAIIDPDKLTGDKGFTKITTRIVQALFLIVLIPFAFDFAYDLQNNIVEKNIMTKIVFGGEMQEASSPGQTLARTTLNAFYRCRDDLLTAQTDPSDQTKIIMVCEDGGGIEGGFDEAFPDNGSSKYSTLRDILNNKKNKEYLYEYNAGISTLVGGVIVFLLISFTIDVAVRAVKLSFLQLITPVAVIGYIEPGGGIFKKWLKMTLTTFTNLFIRLLALSFVGYIISIVVDFPVLPAKSGETITSTTEAFVRIFIIIGALMFAKEAPKMLSNLFGLDEGSLGSLNPLKKLGAVPTVATGLLGAGTALGAKAVGTIAGGISGGMAAAERGGSGLAGVGQGMLKGGGNVKVGAGYKGGLKGIGKSVIGGTFGASNKGGSYAASKVTGNENEQVGFRRIAENIKSYAGHTAESMHKTKLDENYEEKYKGIKEKIDKGESIYANKDYEAMVNKYKESKTTANNFENERQYWLTRYQSNPLGDYTGTDGNTYTFKEAFEKSNQNYKSAQKNIEYYNSELEKMEAKYEYQEDAATRKFYEETKKKREVPTFKEVSLEKPKDSGSSNKPL